jgi:TonB family protein
VTAAAPTGRAWKTIEQPLYPLGAVQRGIEGQLVVEFRVDEAGKVIEPRVVESVPPEVFDGSVLKTMAGWRYNVDYDRATRRPATPLRTAFFFQIEPCARLSYLTPEGAVRATDVQQIDICENRDAGRRATVPPSQSDALFETAGLKEQMGRPEYVGALRAAEADAAKIQTQRSIPHDGGEVLKRRTSLPRPVINPHIRRAGVPVTAVVMFDVDGSGRVKNVAAVPSPGGQELSDVLAHAVSGWLFEPKIENGVGMGRAGLVAFLSVEFDDSGKSSCGKHKSAIPADFAERVCFRATH